MSSVDLTRSFYIGDWLVEPKLNKISRHGEVHQVEPKLIEVLVYLAEYQGEVRTKDEIITEVWKEAYITENVLSRAISKLRKILSDDAEEPHIIETIRKQGYRLIAPVRVFSTSEAQGNGVHQKVSLRDEMQRFVANNLALSFLVMGIFIGGLSWVLIGSVFTDPPLPSIRPLTSYSGLEREPKISPDGTRIVFSWAGGGSSELNNDWDIYVKLNNDENPLRITDEPGEDRSPVWSPDGSRIAYIRYENGDCNIYLVSALGGTSQRLAPCTLNTLPDLAWSPDGQWLAYSDRDKREDPHSIYLLSPETGEKKKITTPPSNFWGDLDPEFSPDAKKIALTRYAGEGLQDLYTIDIDGSNEQRLTFDNMNMNSYVWSTNSNYIYFSSNAGGGNQLWRISASGGRPTLFLLSESDIGLPSASSGNEKLAYVKDDFDVNIWKLEAEDNLAKPGTKEKYIASTKWDMHPNMSPDGSKIAFTSNRSGSYEVWVADRDGLNLVKLTSFEQSLSGSPRWAPDNETIVFDARSRGQADIYMINIHERIPVRLTDTEHNEVGASWSSNGQWIYYSSNLTGNWEIWKMSPEEKEPTQVTFNGGMGALESVDGAYLYHSRKETPGLWRLNLRTLEEEQLIEDLMPNDWASWDMSTSGIFYISRRQRSIAFYDFDTGTISTVYQVNVSVPSMDAALSVSTDGTEIFLGQIDHSERDFMLIENFGEIQK